MKVYDLVIDETVEDDLPKCDCCGLPSVLLAECWHWFCDICVGREHHIDCFLCRAKPKIINTTPIVEII